MSFADYDGDGDLDLLGGQEDGRLLYVCNMGTASAPSFAWPVLGDSRCYLNNYGAVQQRECGQPSVLLESPPPPPFMPLPLSTGDDLCYSVNLDGLVHVISPVTSLPHPNKLRLRRLQQRWIQFSSSLDQSENHKGGTHCDRAVIPRATGLSKPSSPRGSAPLAQSALTRPAKVGCIQILEHQVRHMRST